MFVRHLENVLQRAETGKTSFFNLFEIVSMGQNEPKNSIFLSFSHCRKFSTGRRNMLDGLKDALGSQCLFAFCFRTFAVQNQFLL